MWLGLQKMKNQNNWCNGNGNENTFFKRKGNIYH